MVAAGAQRNTQKYEKVMNTKYPCARCRYLPDNRMNRGGGTWSVSGPAARGSVRTYVRCNGRRPGSLLVWNHHSCCPKHINTVLVKEYEYTKNGVMKKGKLVSLVFGLPVDATQVASFFFPSMNSPVSSSHRTRRNER